MVECLFTSEAILVPTPVPVTGTSDITGASSKEFLDIEETIECGFTLKRVRDMKRIYTQLHGADKYSE